MDAPDGKSWLVEHAKDLGFNGIWFNPFFETTQLGTVNSKKEPVSHSIYAICNHFALDSDVSATYMPKGRAGLLPHEREKVDQLDLRHLEYFNAQAKENGLRVYPDLVFNHVAADHPLVAQENRDIALLKARHPQHWPVWTPVPGEENVHAVTGLGYRDEKGEVREYGVKFCRNEHMEVLNIGMTTGYDTAQVNFASPAAKEFFITGKEGQPGYWKQAVDWCMDRGFDSFRCDIAYKIPPGWWSEIIGHAKRRDPGVVFMAETLGAPDAAVERMAHIRVPDEKGGHGPGFHLGMSSVPWWDKLDHWLPNKEHPRLLAMSKYGGAGCPDNHDTEQTLAGALRMTFNRIARVDEGIAHACVRDWAVSVLAFNSAYMQMGYEYCKEKQNGVFRGEVSPADWEELTRERAGRGPLDISGRIRALNELKESLDVGNCRPHFRELVSVQGGNAIRMHVEYIDVDTHAKKAGVVLLLNRRPENGVVTLMDRNVFRGTEGMECLQAEGERHAVQDVVVFHTPVERSSGMRMTLQQQPLRLAAGGAKP